MDALTLLLTNWLSVLIWTTPKHYRLHVFQDLNGFTEANNMTEECGRASHNQST